MRVIQYLKGDNVADAIRIAALHSLRRVFVHYLEHKKIVKCVPGGNNEMEKLKDWLAQQLISFQQLLCSLIIGSEPEMQVASIRTLMEVLIAGILIMAVGNLFFLALQFVRREYLMSAKAVPSFGVEAYSALLKAVLHIPDLDADVFIMMREEVFTLHDCAYQAMLIIRRILMKVKPRNDTDETTNEAAERELVTKNAIDVIRMIDIDEGVDLSASNCLIDISAHSGCQPAASSDEYDSDDSLEAMDRIDEEGEAASAVLKKKLQISTSGVKRGASSAGMEQSRGATKRLRKKTSRAAQALDFDAHKRAFSKLWLSLMSLEMTAGQHKIVLKHLPYMVLPYLDQPLLLADYLTRSYESGGVVSVLALESLFQVILKNNLDYPNFFRSLYRLCTVEVFSAKYRTKFMKLLHMSLKSTNLAAYLVAAFAKRLARLALFVPGPVAVYCIAQVTWLLRRHPQCMVLIHRTTNKDDTYDENEEDDIEKCNALTSSLWELEALKNHYYYQVASLAKSLENEASTVSGPKEILINIDDFIAQSYGSLIEEELRSVKKRSALAFSEPTGVFSSSAVDSGFCNSLAIFRNNK